MRASRVVLNQEMLEALSKPGLNRTKRSKLRLQHLKEYVQSFENGHAFKLSDLIWAAGYDPVHRYGPGWAWIKHQASPKVHSFVLEKLPAGQGYNVFFDESKTTTGVDLFNATSSERAAAFRKAKGLDVEVSKEDHEQLHRPDPFESPVMYTAAEIAAGAKDFAWHNNSDSLREFVKYLCTK